MSQRAWDLSAVPVDLVPIPAEQVIAGEPAAGDVELVAGGLTAGVWEIGAGTVTDVEVDELAVVLSGRASVVVNDGERIELRPGVLLRLEAGDRTVWTVTEPLRKLYVLPPA